ncbi:amidohydrolase/deacetylase family metallohydrolase [Chloroflexota bacterium]
MYELLLKGGEVIDPAQGIHDQKDVAISGGKIAAVSGDIKPSEAKRIIDIGGKIVTPGLIDIHAHVDGGIRANGLAPDEAGVFSGVTTVCDAGSTGYANFTGFRKFVISEAQTEVFCFLHMGNTGLAVAPEIWSWRNINPKAMLSVIAENRDIIKGIKIRALKDVIANLGVEAIKATKKVASEAKLPIMIHLGIDIGDTVPADKMSTFTREMLCLLDRGDILTHIFTWKPGGVISPDGSVVPELREAIQRGVVIDVAPDRVNWSFDIAKKGLEQGILPTTISTDISEKSLNSLVFSLPAIMSRFLALGLSLDQVVAMTTINSARVLGEEQRKGSLGVGMPADVSILELIEGDFVFADGIPGKTSNGKLLLVPRLTIKSGVEVQTHPRFENTSPGWQFIK